MTDFERKLPLEGIDNFRDYGGYPTASGRTIRTGLLYRSANHGTPTPGDLERVEALRLAAVVDLRRKAERERNPAQRPARFEGELIANDLGDEDEDHYHIFLRTSDLSPKAMADFLVDYYRAAPFEPRHIDLFSRYFRALAEGSGPILIHCAAGKDRTGILAALTHHLAGVSREDIIADYMLTNDEARFARRIPLFTDYVVEISGGRRPTPEAVRTTLGVEPIYLETALEAIEASHGSVEAYIRDGLGVDEAMKTRIEARLFED